MTIPQRPRAQRGFTLVEAIVAVVIIGIIGAIVAVFIRAPIQGYADSVARAETGDEADLALRRMAREIRLALPNSVRVSASGDAIEFLLTKTGGRYLAAEDAVADAAPLDFVDPGKTAFTVVGGLRADVEAGDYVVVYNLGPDMAPADAYRLNDPARNIAVVKTPVAAGGTTIELVDNPFARDDAMPSPGRRFQVVATPVTFRCAREGGNFVLRRFAGYGIRAAIEDPMPDPRGTLASAVLARRVSACDGLFEYELNDAELRRSALVLLTLGLSTRGAGQAGAADPDADPDAGSVRLVHQVHVDNTP